MKIKKPLIVRPQHRARVLAQRRSVKMASSAHAYVRGSTVQFYRWLQLRGAKAVPKGPSVWICGDCHSGNLGPLAAPDGKVYVQIRDLDQTVIGNPNHDLIRLALSLASAARGSNLPGLTTARMLEEMMVGYQHALRGSQARSAIDSEKPLSIRVVMRKAVSRTWKNLAEERLVDISPNIPRGDRFWHMTQKERRAVDELFNQANTRTLVTMLQSRSTDSRISVVDAAYWMKGCSSLGRLRYAVLLRLREGKAANDRFCLMDIKEATAAAAPRANDRSMPKDNAKRVVEGAKHLSPALGERMMSARLLDRAVVLRELMPQDLKLQIDRLSPAQAVLSARYLAEVVGKAHARQMDAPTRREFLRMLKTRRGSRLDAPSWLWTSVVELLSTHEAAYLEHCRRYAAGPKSE